MSGSTSNNPSDYSSFVTSRNEGSVRILSLHSTDGSNRLTRGCVAALLAAVKALATQKQPLIITGNKNLFSAGADLHEISALDATSTREFAKLGQALMNAIEAFPAPVFAAVSGFCMGGGLDLAPACNHRIAASGAVFGHRGAALGLLTGWGGTQRLSRLIGKAKTLQLLTAAERISADEALGLRLVESVVEDPVAEAMRRFT
ncbi:MAG TPA: enoyl-CoA hydratase/isomerase family protein [Terriglobales bacterium]|nr:enoyl-CoA hydratase/isomerase family protein [Terriglobales bacterium]